MSKTDNISLIEKLCILWLDRYSRIQKRYFKFMNELFRLCCYFSLILLSSCNEKTFQDISTDQIDYFSSNCKTQYSRIYYPLCNTIEEQYHKLGIKNPIDVEYNNPTQHKAEQKYSSLQCKFVNDVLQQYNNEKTQIQENQFTEKDRLTEASIDKQHKVWVAFAGSTLLESKENLKIQLSKITKLDNAYNYKYLEWGSLRGLQLRESWCIKTYDANRYRHLDD